jgi:predicted site-specific integrase-resolvase
MPESSQTTRQKPLLTEVEVADLFGVTARTIRNWAATGHLSPLRIAGTTRYRAAEIQALIEPPSSGETEEEVTAA